MFTKMLFLTGIVILPVSIHAQILGFSDAQIIETDSNVKFGLHSAIATDHTGTWINIVWDRDFHLTRSTDDGRTWTPLRQIAPIADRGNDAHIHKLETDGLGNWAFVYTSTIEGGFNNYLIRSTDNGTTWSQPIDPEPNPDGGTHQDLQPSIAMDQAGHWMIAYDSGENLVPFEDVFVLRSSDFGQTWTGPTTVPGTRNTAIPDLATDGQGVWAVVYMKLFRITVSRSTDFGATWSEPFTISTTPEDGSLRDYAPRIAADGMGNWMVVYESDDPQGGPLGEDDDILFSVSTDNALTWSAPAPVNSTAWIDNAAGARDNDVRLATDRRGNWVAVWVSRFDSVGGVNINTDQDILVAHSRNLGQTWTSTAPLAHFAATDNFLIDASPDIAASTAGTFVAGWTSGYPNTMNRGTRNVVTRSDSIVKAGVAHWTLFR